MLSPHVLLLISALQKGRIDYKVYNIVPYYKKLYQVSLFVVVLLRKN